MICPSCGSEIPDGSESCFICGEPIVKARSASYGGGSSYGGPAPDANQYYVDRYGDTNQPVMLENSGRSLDKKTYSIIVGGLIGIVLLLGVIFCIRSGFFVSKDGVYRSDDLKTAFENAMKAEGYGSDPILNQIEYDCTLTVNGGKCTLRMAVKMYGEVIFERSMDGDISFYGTKVVIRYNNMKGDNAEYDPALKTISFGMDDPELEQFGLERLTFKLEE
ncbi:MAG: zinc ribbon domain-containing protein [Eubacterium sp.]|nr:zinc ribbon domain-containing protein [Eubacterium sp.]